MSYASSSALDSANSSHIQSPTSYLPFFASLVALWLLLFYRLSVVWEYEDQYSHGWFVPLLAGYIFWQRWQTKPKVDSVQLPVGSVRFSLNALVFLLLLPLAFAYFVAEANPDWRLMLWIMAGCVFVGSLALTQLVGGIPWRNHLAFAFFFALVSVPWPTALEKNFALELSMIAAQITTAVLSILGIPAVCSGNTIEIAAGTLGVEEACSGIRSFQSSLMAGLFLGELYMLKPVRRIVLCVDGLIIAFALNVGRMLLLSLAVQSSGMHAIEKWHDPAGFAILIITMACLWGSCLLFGSTPALRAATSPSNHATPRRAPATVFVVAAALLMVLSTEAFYRVKEHSAVTAPTWALVAAGGAGDAPLDARAQQLLLYDVGLQRSWTTADGLRAHAIYLVWNPSRKGAYAAAPHNPEICQGALGRKVEAKSAFKIADVHGLKIRYQILTVQNAGSPFYLMFIPGDTRMGSRNFDPLFIGAFRGGMTARRVEWALHGMRNTGQRSMQIALVGPQSAEEAEAKLLAMLPDLIRREEPERSPQ